VQAVTAAALNDSHRLFPRFPFTLSTGRSKENLLKKTRNQDFMALARVRGRQDWCDRTERRRASAAPAGECFFFYLSHHFREWRQRHTPPPTTPSDRFEAGAEVAFRPEIPAVRDGIGTQRSVCR